MLKASYREAGVRLGHHAGECFVAIVRRSVPGALLAAALAVVTAACGPSHTPPPRAVMLNAQAVVDPLAGDTSVWVLRHASANTEAAFAVHLNGTADDSGRTVRFDLSVAGSDGCTGDVSETKEGSFQLIFDGSTVWIKPDDEFWRNAAGITDPAQLAAVEGKYVTGTASASSLGELTSLCQLKTLLKSFATIPAADAPDEIKSRVTRINGQRALKVSDTKDSAYVYVTDSAQPKLLQLIDPGSGGVNFTFGYPGTPVAINPPPASEIASGN
jgi:hypothetical protein